jgi:hypothetical protein
MYIDAVLLRSNRASPDRRSGGHALGVVLKAKGAF